MLNSFKISILSTVSNIFAIRHTAGIIYRNMLQNKISIVTTTFSKSFYLNFLLAVFSLAGAHGVFGITISSTQNGDWNSTSTWNCACIPGASDDVTIEHVVTLSMSTAVNSLDLGEEFSPNAGVGNLAISSNSTLTVATGATNLNRSGNAITVDAGSSLIKTAGDFIISSTGTATINGTLDVQSGSFSVSGGNGANMSVGASGNLNVSGNYTFAHNNQTITVEGTVTVGSMSATGGGGTTFVIESGATFNITNALTITTTQNYTVRGTLNIGSVAVTGGSPDFDIESSGEVNVSGSFSLASSGSLQITSTTGSLNVGGDFSIAGGADAEVDGILIVEGTLDIANNGNKISGTGTVAATTATCPGDDCGTIGSADAVETAAEVLPVELSYFTYTSFDRYTELIWKTETEKDNHYFTVENSTDGVNFYLVAEIPGNGTSKQSSLYNLEVESASDHTFYRLTQTDFDGTSVQLGIIHVKAPGVSDFFKVYPTFTTPGQRVNIVGEVTELVLFNIDGQAVHKASSGILPSHLNPGLFILRIANPSIAETHRIIVQ